MAFKKNKAKMIGVVTTIAAASLVSVGFAAWSIANVKQADVGNSITVHGEVSENILSFDLHSGSASSGSFVFGKPATTNIDGAWLLPDTTVASDSLSELTFQWDFTTRDGYNATATIGYVEDAAYTTWSAAVTKGYVEQRVLTAVADNSTHILTVKFQVGWGSYFGHENPYTFYNTEHKYDDEITSGVTYGDHATAALNDAVFKNLSGISLKIRVKIS